jgi:hypothetical protein
LTGLNSSGGVIIVTDTSRFKRVEDRKCAGVIGILLTGLNSFSRVIIVINTSRFERVKDRKRTSVISTLLTGLNMIEPLGLWQSIKNVKIAYW